MANHKRFTIHSKNLFLLIILVAVLSLVFHINLGYYGLMDDRAQPGLLGTSGLYMPDAEVRMSEYKVLGRSLNQHESYKQGGQSGSMDSYGLLGRLQELEVQLLRSQTKPILAVVGSNIGSTYDMPSATRVAIAKSVKGGLTWAGEDIVIQGNWSLLLCMDNSKCIETPPHISQKVNRIQELRTVSIRPELLCSIANAAEKRNGRGDEVCHESHSDKLDDIKSHSLVVTPHKEPEYIGKANYLAIPTRNGTTQVTVWPIHDMPLAFKGGHILTLRVLIASMVPLRFYMSPIITTRKLFNITEAEIQKKQYSLDDVLQSVSETYGLGTASRWWNNIQSMLLTYMFHLEHETFGVYASKKCRRCFQVYDMDVICTSVQICHIIQIRDSTAFDEEDLTSLLKLEASGEYVATDVWRALEQSELCSNTQNCDNIYLESCLTDVFLTFLLDWRRETKAQTSWIPIYPASGDYSTSRSLVNEMISELSATSKCTDLLSELAAYYNEQDVANQQELQYVAEDMVNIAEPYHNKDHTDFNFKCSQDIEDYGKLDRIVTSPKVNVDQTSDSHYNITVGYHTLVLRVRGVQKHCQCEVRLENKYNTPGARNITLGLGETVLRIYIVDTLSDNKVLSVATLSILRKEIPPQTVIGSIQSNIDDERVFGLKQDCDMVFDKSAHCGIVEVPQIKPIRQCSSGDEPGQWLVPCSSRRHRDDGSCDWSRSSWQPYNCSYTTVSKPRLKQCLNGKKLLFIGDSTNRGVANYIMEEINGTLYDWDKTHTTRVYNNVNSNKTQFTFAYYPHFWLPANHRPTFKKVIYQLIKSSLPLQNNSNTVLVLGGVQWLAKQHIDLIIEALQRKGLSGITKIVKGLGAGFNFPVEGVRYVPPSDQPGLQQREQTVLDYAKPRGFQVVATFNMTIARYKDFLEGNCACHFHKVTRLPVPPNHYQNQYTVHGDINAAYSQILLNQIC